MQASVVLFAPLRRPLTYLVPEEMAVAVGDLVKVELGSRTARGLVVELAKAGSSGDARRLKRILGNLGASGLAEDLIRTLLTAAAEFMTPPGALLALALPPVARGGGGRYVKAANPGGVAPLAMLSVKPLLSAGATPVMKLRKILGKARYDKEIPPLIEAGWLITLDRPPSASGDEPWLRWRPDAPELPARKKIAAQMKAALPSWMRRSELVTRIPAAGVQLPGLIKAGFIELERRPKEWRGEGSLTQEYSPELNREQQPLAAKLIEAVRAQRAETFLLTGPTGSGKTAVYLEALRAAWVAGRPGILMVPEIGLLPQTLARLQPVFGDKVAVFHSELSEGSRAAAWSRVKSGDVAVVAGVRSALFAPLRPGVIVMDEEQDSAYRQAATPAYSARHLALQLSRLAPCPLILASATPAVESAYAAREGGIFTPLRLTARAGGAQLPEVRVLDMRGTPPEQIIHPELRDAILAAFSRGEKAILLRNRRGWAAQVICRSCGYLVQCAACAVAMTLHQESGRRFLLCHLCGSRANLPTHCPGCGGDFLQLYGAGTQRLFDEVLKQLPGAKPLRLDRDSARSGGAARLLEEFKSGDANILVGTQMLAKGHDVAAVTVVGVLSADGMLGLPDFRAAERLFALLTQATGRAGRGRKPGVAYIQALSPEHYAVAAAVQQDYEAFFNQEIRLRKLGGYPPFGALSRLLITDADSDAAFAVADGLAKRLRDLAGERLQILGPAFCPIEKMQNRYRVQIILKGNSRKAIAAALEAGLPEQWPAGLRVEMEPEGLF
jgi:primosomal protein N' (replication factor Y)